ASANASTFILSNNHVTSISPLHSVQIISQGTGSQTVSGTAFDDAIYTSDDPNHTGSLVFHGLAGNDEIWGGVCNDTIDGGAGNDILHGQGGIDTVSYMDTVGPTGVTVSLALQGSAQNTIGAGNDTLYGFRNLAG